MSYATVSDFQQRFDSRIIAQLSNDANSATITTANVQACLDDGAAAVNTACLQGSQYTVSDLTNLVSSGDTQVVRMNCDIAIRLLAARRAIGISGAIIALTKDTYDLLSLLQEGKRVLNVARNRTADIAAMVNITAVQASNIQPGASLQFFGGPTGTPSVNGPYGGV